MSNSLSDSGASYLLTARSERPIEGCEITPNAFLQLKGGVMDNLTRSKLLESVPYFYSFSWSRGPRKQICSNIACPRGNTFEPMYWSKAALGGPELVCSVCEKAGKPGYESSFCSVSCFKQSWKQHSRCHPVVQKSQISNRHGRASQTGTPTPAEDEENAAIEDSLSTMVDLSSVSNWVHIFDDKMYTPGHDDVGCRLRIQVSALSVADNSVLAGPIEIFTEPVLSSPVAPPKRRLMAVPGAMQGNMSASVRFRVISYNVLSEIYATKQAYPYCDAWNLSWPYRRKVMLAELEEAQGDVVCLQEVQADHYEAHMLPMMKDLGYDGLFKPKSRECTGLYGKVDGCATFWKRNRFILTENYAIEFNDIARKEAADFGMDDTEARKFMNRLSRDNIAQIIILEALQPGRPANASRSSRSNICVVNTHLYSNHQRADVKLWQSVNLMREVQHFITARDLALILCGDFNSEPTSAVYEYMVTGGIEQSHPDLNIGQHSVRILPADASLITHNIEMGSAMFSGMGVEPQFTNYTANFKGTLDYIFYTPSRLRVMAVTSLPEEEEVRQSSGEGLPSTCYPSDHMMLCCDVAMVVSGTGSILRHPQMQQHHNHQQHSSPQKGKNYNRNK